MGNFAGVDRRAHPPMQGEQDVELRKVGFDGGRHLRILQLAGDPFGFKSSRLVHLAERRGGRGLEIELGEAFSPFRPELGVHAAAYEARAHRRRLRLQADELARIVGRQRVGDSGQKLRDLHHRALHRAQQRRQRLGVGLAPAPAQPVDAHARGERARIDPEARIPGGARAQPVGFVVLAQLRYLPSVALLRRAGGPPF